MDAREFALKRHGNQRWFVLPFAEHLDRVASFFPKEGLRRDTAYLHDLLEDTTTTFAELVSIFGMPVARTVQLLTKTEGLAIAKYYQAIYCHTDARALKLADLEVNLSQCIINLNTFPRNNGWGRETERKIQNYAHYIVYLTTGKWMETEPALSKDISDLPSKKWLMKSDWENFPSHPE